MLCVANLETDTTSEGMGYGAISDHACIQLPSLACSKVLGNTSRWVTVSETDWTLLRSRAILRGILRKVYPLKQICHVRIQNSLSRSEYVWVCLGTISRLESRTTAERHQDFHIAFRDGTAALVLSDLFPVFRRIEARL